MKIHEMTNNIHVTEASYFIHGDVILKAIESNWNGQDFSSTVAVRKVTRMYVKDNAIRAVLDPKTHVIRLSAAIMPVSAATAYQQYKLITGTTKVLAGNKTKKIT